MRRTVVVISLLAMSLSVPALAEAANNQRRVRPGNQRTTARPRTVVRPLPRPRSNGRALMDSRTPVEAEYGDQGYDDQVYGDDQGYEPEQRARPIALGRTQMRNRHGPNGFTPRAPGFGSFEPFVGGKAKAMSKVGMVVTTVAALAITALAITFIGVPLLHNLPQILGGGP